MYWRLGLVFAFAFSGLMLTPTSSLAVGETCDGLPATIVGSPGIAVKGTEGDDVIVSNGAGGVFGKGGNDTICTTGSTRDVLVEGGAGVNLVDRRGDLDPAAGSLVFEANTFYGNDGRDVLTVTTTNTVATGGGDDYVTFGDTNARYSEVAGTIDLGDGDDFFVADGDNGPLEPPSLRSQRTPKLTAIGGSGEDQLTMLAYHAGRWTFDASRGRLSSGRVIELAFRGFEDYESGSFVDRVRLDFLGSSRSESFYEADQSQGVVRSVRMGRGDDEVRVFGCGLCSSTDGVIDGGSGRDLLKFQDFQKHKTVINLAEHRFSRTRDGQTWTNRLAAVEDVQVYSYRTVTLTGDGHDNDLRVWGCREAVIRGGGGDDSLYYLAKFQLAPQFPVHSPEKGCERHLVNLIADGGAGRDLLRGGPGADFLDGGPGRDTAVAGHGKDRCPEVEVRKGCERR